MDPEKYGLKFIENLKKEIQDQYTQCVVRFFVNIELPKQEYQFDSYVLANHYNDSWFAYDHDDSCKHWHTDGNNKLAMVIAAWPSPTQILLGDYFNEDFNCGCDQAALYDEVSHGTKRGKYKIFEPEPGDVWFLPEGTIHRGNPKDIGSSHLVVRRWYKKTPSNRTTDYSTFKLKSF